MASAPEPKSDLLQQLDTVSSGESGVLAEIRWLAWNQANLDARLQAVENSKVFHTLQWIGHRTTNLKLKLGNFLLHSPLHPWIIRLMGTPQTTQAYRLWRSRPQDSPQESLEVEIRSWARQPTVSILVPVCQPNLDWFREMVESVRGQVYPRWELCICVDGTRSEELGQYLAAVTADDPRIQLTLSPERRGISSTFNQAATLASGEFFAFLDHDDRLSPLALYHLVKATQARQADILYSDEEYISQAGELDRPILKPGWSPELLSTCMYMGHLLVLSRRRYEQVGGFRPEFDGAQDYDLALRATEGDVSIVHIPEILYQWRQHRGSTALLESAKPGAQDAGLRALRAAALRRGWKAEVVPTQRPFCYRPIHPLPPRGTVSLIICSRKNRLLERCLRRLRENTSYKEFELIAICHTAGLPEKEVQEFSRIAERLEARRLDYQHPFNFAEMCNQGARAARGDYLVFLNDDVEPRNPEWLEHMVRQLHRAEIGVVGALLLYPGGSIQHSGIVVGMADGAGHAGRNLYESEFWGWLRNTRDVSAVTGACLGVRKQVFLDLGGFDVRFPVNYNDVDFCLRTRLANFRVVVESHSVLTHLEGQTRILQTGYVERRDFFHRWASRLDATDEFYSPLLDLSTEQTTLRVD